MLTIAGAGLFGLTIAERAANNGHDVTIYDLRSHIGGNAWSYTDQATGIEVHAYGSHIFHTNNEKVWEYCNRFTEFFPYQHRVRTVLPDDRVIPLPFGLASYSAFFNRVFTPRQLKAFIDTRPQQSGDSLEDAAISSLGRDMYEAVVKGYTKKQWGRDPRDLPRSTIQRLPIRYTWDDGYFTDKYQGLPLDGYDVFLSRMVDHPRITVRLGEAAPVDARPLVWTGPIDAFFGYRHGQLGWRIMDLVLEVHEDDFQGCPVMNYADVRVPWTRIHEYRHYRPDREARGSIVHFEHSREARRGEVGSYPVNTAEDRSILERYRLEAEQFPGVWFGGRLGSYKYLDMHMAIASALSLWDNELRDYLEAGNA